MKIMRDSIVSFKIKMVFIFRLLRAYMRVRFIIYFQFSFQNNDGKIIVKILELAPIVQVDDWFHFVLMLVIKICLQNVINKGSASFAMSHLCPVTNSARNSLTTVHKFHRKKDCDIWRIKCTRTCLIRRPPQRPWL